MNWLWFALPLVIAAAAQADNAEEIQERIKRWQHDLPQYTESPNTPVPPGPSITAIYATDRTGVGGDPLVAGFLERGYYMLDALRAKADMAPLTETEIRAYHDALRLSRVVFVDHELYDNRGKRVVAVTDSDPQAPRFKLIQIYRKDWQDSARLGADLTQTVFHEYLRAIGKNDDQYVVSSGLTVSERDFQKTFHASADCVSGKTAPAHIGLNLASGSVYERAMAYVNGYAIGDERSFRVTNSTPICTARAYRFEVKLADYTKTLYLFGGDEITLMVPSDQEYYQP